MEEIVRRSWSLKPTDNEIRLGSYKDEIRSATRVHTNKADRTPDPFKVTDQTVGYQSKACWDIVLTQKSRRVASTVSMLLASGYSDESFPLGICIGTHVH